MKRGLFIATSVSAALAACSPIGTRLNDTKGFHSALESAERLNDAIIGTRGRAQLYSPADISKDFPVNSLPTPMDSVYNGLVSDGFRSYRLVVDGLVDHPQALSLTQLQHLMNITQITRHD